MVPNPLHAVIFDMDGLLLDTEAVYRTAATEAGDHIGYAMPDALYARTIGVPRDTTRAILIETFGADFPLEAFEVAMRKAARAIFDAGIPVKAGAQDLLRLLAARNIPAAVATSTARETALSHLRESGLIDYFGAIVTRTDVTQGKPHPEPFLKAAAALGVAPSACLALEDSHNGIRAAHAAGMATVMVPDLLTPTDDIRALCAAVVDSLHDVHDAIALATA